MRGVNKNLDFIKNVIIGFKIKVNTATTVPIKVIVVCSSGQLMGNKSGKLQMSFEKFLIIYLP